MPPTLMQRRRRASARCNRRRLHHYSHRRRRSGSSSRKLQTRQPWMLHRSRVQKLRARRRQCSRRLPTLRSCDPVCSSEPRIPSRGLAQRVHSNRPRQSPALRRRLCSSDGRSHGRLCRRCSLQPQKSLHSKPFSRPKSSAVQGGSGCKEPLSRHQMRVNRRQPSRQRRPGSLRDSGSVKHRRLSPKCHCCDRHPGRAPRPRSCRHARSLQRVRQQSHRRQILHSARRRSKPGPHRARRRSRTLQRRPQRRDHATWTHLRSRPSRSPRQPDRHGRARRGRNRLRGVAKPRGSGGRWRRR